MKNYMLLVMLQFYTIPIIYSASTHLEDDIKKNHPDNVHQLTQVFLDNAGLYHMFKDYEDPSVAKAILKTLATLIATNPKILASEDKPYPPLTILAAIAVGKSQDSPEWQIFSQAAELDTDNNRRLHAMWLGIWQRSVPIVEKMLAVGTDITNYSSTLRDIMSESQTTDPSQRESLLEIHSLLSRYKINSLQMQNYPENLSGTIAESPLHVSNSSSSSSSNTSLTSRLSSSRQQSLFSTPKPSS